MVEVTSVGDGVLVVFHVVGHLGSNSTATAAPARANKANVDFNMMTIETVNESLPKDL